MNCPREIKNLYVTSTNRDVINYPYGNSYTLYLSTPIKDITNVELLYAAIPNTMYNLNEGFNVQGNEVTGLNNRKSDSIFNPVTLDAVLRTEFKEGNKKNPFSNVLLTQIMDEPNRKSAPPSFNVDVDEDITKNVKRAVQMMNPEIKNSNKQLYGDLWERFELDQSDRAFYSTANTQVEPGDQGAYSKFLYGEMLSGKESNAGGALARLQDNYRYTLY